MTKKHEGYDFAHKILKTLGWIKNMTAQPVEDNSSLSQAFNSFHSTGISDANK